MKRAITYCLYPLLILLAAACSKRSPSECCCMSARSSAAMPSCLPSRKSTMRPMVARYSAF